MRVFEIIILFSFTYTEGVNLNLLVGLVVGCSVVAFLLITIVFSFWVLLRRASLRKKSEKRRAPLRENDPMQRNNGRFNEGYEGHHTRDMELGGLGQGTRNMVR